MIPDVNSRTPGQWLEYSPILTWIIVAIGSTYLWRYFAASSDPLGALTLNVLKVANAAGTIQATMASNKARGVQEVGKFLLTPAPAAAPAGAILTPEQQQQMERD